MCLIAWNWQPDSDTPLLLLGNRDEFYERPTHHAHWWVGGQVLAGKDLRAGGTWLGVSRSGHLAALTNYRLPVIDSGTRPSRGALVAEFLKGSWEGTDYLQSLSTHSDEYSPFNLIVFDGIKLMGFESRNKRIFSIAPGIDGNHGMLSSAQHHFTL